MACDVSFGQPGNSAARKSDAYSLAPVTLATPSMRPAPVAAGFQACRPGSVSRAVNAGSSAQAKRDRLSAMPLAVTDLTNWRREVLMLPLLGQRYYERLDTGYICARQTQADQAQGHNFCFRRASKAASTSIYFGQRIPERRRLNS